MQEQKRDTRGSSRILSLYAEEQTQLVDVSCVMQQTDESETSLPARVIVLLPGSCQGHCGEVESVPEETRSRT